MLVLFGTIFEDLQTAFSFDLIVLSVGPELCELLDNNVSNDLISTFVACLNVFTFNLIPTFDPS
jgi:hypothetical protein